MDKKMDKEKYIGHDTQLYGVEEHRLIGGKGDGMRLFQVKNGLGLEFTVSADRCADISRLTFKGDNLSYLSPVGYVAPSYYDDKGIGFLKSFTAGFLTTCGLSAVGNPCDDEGESLPLHGTISNTPAEWVCSETVDDNIIIRARINDSGLFSKKLIMNRKISTSKLNNIITIEDSITNVGSKIEPLMVLYHFNMGYPLLSENSELYIPSDEVKPRDQHASDNMDSWNNIQEPTLDYQEQCFYHTFEKYGIAGIYNHDINKGLVIRFDKNSLDHFVQWKMMGEREYVLGLEPGNCHPDGRDQMREDGKLKFIQPNETKSYSINIEMFEGIEKWQEIKE